MNAARSKENVNGSEEKHEIKEMPNKRKMRAKLCQGNSNQKNNANNMKEMAGEATRRKGNTKEKSNMKGKKNTAKGKEIASNANDRKRKRERGSPTSRRKTRAA